MPPSFSQFIVGEKVPLELTILKKRIDSANFIQKTIRDARDTDLRDCCWICENWMESEFTWDPKTSGKEHIIDPLFVSFNFEDYRP